MKPIRNVYRSPKALAAIIVGIMQGTSYGPEGRDGAERECIALIEEGAELDYIGGNPSESLLAMAIKRGMNKVVESLLDKGANPDTVSQWKTPLLCALIHKNHHAVDLLIDAGADPDAKDSGGFSARTARKGVFNPQLDHAISTSEQRIKEKNALKAQALAQAAHKGADQARESAPMPVIKKKPFKGPSR